MSTKRRADPKAVVAPVPKRKPVSGPAWQRGFTLSVADRRKLVAALTKIVNNPKSTHREICSAARELARLAQTELRTVEVRIIADQHQALVARFEALEKRIDEAAHKPA